jgi:hypothetical protein
MELRGNSVIRSAQLSSSHQHLPHLTYARNTTMKLSTVVFSLLVAAVSVRAADKQYIVTFSNEASDKEVKTSQDTLTGKGCTITHLYSKPGPALSYRSAHELMEELQL